MKQPKIGDKKDRGICPYCGEPMFYIWSSEPAYHNDSIELWKSDGHADTPGPKYVLQLGQCVSNLNKRIERLENLLGRR